MTERYIASVDQGTTSSRCIVFDHARARRLRQPARAPPPLPAARPGSSTTRRRSGERAHGGARGARLGRADRPRPRRRSASPTSARPPCCGTARPASRCTTRSSGRTPARTGSSTSSAGDVGQRPLPRPLRAAAGHLLLRTARSAGCSTTSPACASAPRPARCSSGRWTRWLDLEPHAAATVTDVTNAGRTMLMNLDTLDWDDVLLDAHRRAARDAARRSGPRSEVYGEAHGELAGLPVAAALGDQHAALFGQTCFDARRGQVHLRHGQLPAAEHRHRAGAVDATACSPPSATRSATSPPMYALEGSIAVTGALVQWFRDKLGLIGSAPEIETLARTVDDNGGCYIVPAFSGLFAPHWRSDARGVHRRADRLHHQGPPRPRRAGGHRLADARGGRGDERRRRRRPCARSRSTAA